MNKPRFTETQGRYLAFLHAYTSVHGHAPSEAEMQKHFQVSAPSVHRMVVTLEQRGLITREPGMARSIRVLVPTAELPPLEGAKSGARERRAANSAEDPQDRAAVVEQTGREVVKVILARALDLGIDDADSLPLIAAAAGAIEKMLRAAGTAPRGARLVRERVLHAAEEEYVRLCSKHDEEGDPAEDAARFRELLEPDDGRG
ncbi:LexA family protein [Polyangium fumosum]|uniref:LexA family protein n=1 Tax=Polyangium fumosum TaxID=889272 RepID=UPI001B8713D1|nr:MarR family transcriptional regulator [Polyangium fumosum]